jgi:hypothetical protein
MKVSRGIIAEDRRLLSIRQSGIANDPCGHGITEPEWVITGVEHPHAMTRRRPPGRVDRQRREEVDVRVDDHGAPPASDRAAARAAVTMFW